MERARKAVEMLETRDKMIEKEEFINRSSICFAENDENINTVSKIMLQYRVRYDAIISNEFEVFKIFYV